MSYGCLVDAENCLRKYKSPGFRHKIFFVIGVPKGTFRCSTFSHLPFDTEHVGRGNPILKSNYPINARLKSKGPSKCR